MPAQRNAKRRASRPSQQLIAAIETGRTKSTKFLARIALALNRRPGDLDPDWLPVEEQRHAVHSASFGDRDLPVYGSAEGGEGQIIVSPVPWTVPPRLPACETPMPFTLSANP
jgi:hypothetical protein